ncbi:MAG: type IIL restriction-modification enzyme MmeI [Parvularculales bacterium]
MPPVSEFVLGKLEPLAQAVLDARAAHPDSTLADLYDPDLMSSVLRKAHQALDRSVDGLYRKQAFSSDRERVEHLLAMYEKMKAPLADKSGKKTIARKQTTKKIKTRVDS